MTGSAALLNSVRLQTLEQIALLATHVFDAPMAVLHCADGVQPPFKASVGLSAPDAERFQPFCAHCPEGGGAPMVVLNAARLSRELPGLPGLPDTATGARVSSRLIATAHTPAKPLVAVAPVDKNLELI